MMKTASIRFSSRIIVVGDEDFQRLPRRRMRRAGAYSDSPWSVQERILGKPQAYTDKARACLAGGLQVNGLQPDQEMMLFHLVPDAARREDCQSMEENYYFTDSPDNYRQEVLPTLAWDMESLRKKHPQAALSGLIAGGQSNWKPSIRAFNMLTGLFRQSDVPLTTIFGHRHQGETSLYGSAAENTWILSSRSAEARPIRNREDLEETYTHVEIADTDELVFLSKESPLKDSHFFKPRILVALLNLKERFFPQ